MDEAPSHIEMRRTVERNRRQLSTRSIRTANQSGTIHIETGSIPRKAIRGVTSCRGFGSSAINLLMIIIITQHLSVVGGNCDSRTTSFTSVPSVHSLA